MNARNKLKTCDLMGIDTHIVYHAHRIKDNIYIYIDMQAGRNLLPKLLVADN